MAFDRRLATNFDWGTLAFSLAIVSLSIVLLYSATSERLEGPSGMHLKQLVWAVIGLVSMFAVLCIDYQTLCPACLCVIRGPTGQPGHCAPVRSGRQWVATLAGTRALARANLWTGETCAHPGAGPLFYRAYASRYGLADLP